MSWNESSSPAVDAERFPAGFFTRFLVEEALAAGFFADDVDLDFAAELGVPDCKHNIPIHISISCLVYRQKKGFSLSSILGSRRIAHVTIALCVSLASDIMPPATVPQRSCKQEERRQECYVSVFPVTHESPPNPTASEL